MYLDHIKKVHEATLPFPLNGYAEAKVAAEEDRVGRPFPAAYREFLLWSGCGFRPWSGSDYGIEWHPDLQTEALETIAEGRQKLPLPDDAFVFWQHGGNAFFFFRFSEGDDPPVYQYEVWQEEPDFQRITAHFSSLITNALIDILERQQIAVPDELRPGDAQA